MHKYKDKEPYVVENTFVAESADLIGNVVIGEESSIWFGAVLRGDINKITVGKGSNIQDNSTVHVGDNDEVIIGDYVTIGHNVVIHGCKINDNVIIGMGSIILDGAEIGEYSMVGAGSLVTQNKKFPPGMLILGSPAKAIRPLTEEEKSSIQESAKHYIDSWKEY